jgi:streptogramin lyase
LAGICHPGVCQSRQGKKDEPKQRQKQPIIRSTLRATAGIWLSASAILLAQTPAFTEYTIPTAGSAPYEIAAGPDGALWFTEGGVSKIGRITTAGTFTEFLLPRVNSLPEGIAAGPDGALWFTEYDRYTIGRITSAGVINEYATPSPLSGPNSITVGPDGALWFTETLTSKIGRITTRGVFTRDRNCRSGIGKHRECKYRGQKKDAR